LAVIALMGICIGSSAAWSNLLSLVAAPPLPRIDFDQVFADAARSNEVEAAMRQRLRAVGWNFILGSRSLDDPFVNRQRKGDRLLPLKSLVPEPALLPYCEPLASKFVDPVLGRIAGRCMV
jgi:hypothetical protein